MKAALIAIEKREVRAPFDGVLQERDVEIGDFVRSGDALATFVDNLTLIVTGTLAEQEVAYVKAGDTARAELVTAGPARSALDGRRALPMGCSR